MGEAWASFRCLRLRPMIKFCAVTVISLRSFDTDLPQQLDLDITHDPLPHDLHSALAFLGCAHRGRQDCSHRVSWDQRAEDRLTHMPLGR